MNPKPAQIRLIILIVSILVLGLAAWATLLAQRSKNMGIVTVDSVPNDLKLTLDNKIVTNIGTFRVRVGHHTFKASRDHFETQTKDFDIKKGEKQSFEFFLTAIDAAGYQWQADHPDQIYKVEGASGKKFDTNSQAAQTNNPIIAKLPVIEDTFRIDYGTSQKHPDQTGAIALYIQTSTDQGKADALDWMRTFGFNPDNYEIIYTTPGQ